MDDWLTFDNAANAASMGSVALTLLQWLLASAKEKTAQTVGDYLEWLRRTNHAELAAEIEANSEGLTAVVRLIDDVKHSVLQAIVLHEANSEARHDEIKLLIAASRMLDMPRIQVSVLDPIRHWPSGENVKYRMTFQAVNESHCHATIQHAQALIGWSDDGGFGAPLQGAPVLIDVPPLRGASSFTVETVPISPSQKGSGFPKLHSLQLKLSQETKWRSFKLTGSCVFGSVLHEVSSPF